MGSRGNKKKKNSKSAENKIPTVEEAVKNFMSIVKGLPYHTQMAIHKFVELEGNRIQEESKKYFESYYNPIIEGLDRNMTAALILMSDFDMNKIEDIIDSACNLTFEDTKKVLELKKEGKGDWKMVANKMEDTLMKRIKEVLKEGLKQKDTIEKLCFEFPKLSKSMVTNAYKRVKEEEAFTKKAKKIASEVAEDVKKAVDYIFEDNKEGDQLKEVDANKKDKKPVADNISSSSLEIVSKKVIMDVRGHHNYYHVEGKEVGTESVKFKSKEECNEYFSKKIDKLQKEIEKLASEKDEFLEVISMTK